MARMSEAEFVGLALSWASLVPPRGQEPRDWEGWKWVSRDSKYGTQVPPVPAPPLDCLPAKLCVSVWALPAVRLLEQGSGGGGVFDFILRRIREEERFIQSKRSEPGGGGEVAGGGGGGEGLGAQGLFKANTVNEEEGGRGGGGEGLGAWNGLRMRCSSLVRHRRRFILLLVSLSVGILSHCNSFTL